MRTKKFLAGLLMILSFSVTMVSCGKEDLAGSSTGTSVNTTGGIMDLGNVAGNVRGMHVSLTNVEITLANNPDKSAADKTSRLNVYLQTESDGIIKDGVYLFSGTDSASPFIFKSALVDMQNKATGISDTFIVSGGTIVVARSGTYYTFNMKGILSNGNAINASFAGSLSYSD